MLQNTNIIQELGSCYKRIAELEAALLKIFECTYEGDPVKAIAEQALRKEPVTG